MFEDIIKKLANEIEERETIKIEVGKVSPDLAIRFKKNSMEKEELRDRIDVRAEELRKEMRRRMHEEFAEAMDEGEERHDALWNEIYQELGIVDKEAEYQLNARTGIVTKKVNKPNFGDMRH